MNHADAMARGARCDLCPLRKDGVIVPPAVASGKLRLVIVGENPGRHEENSRAPFSGLSGRILERELNKGGIRLSDTHRTYAALCRGDTDKENDRAAECCAPRLLREVSELASGAPLLTMGRAPLRSMLGVRSLLVSRGFIWPTKEADPKGGKAALKAAYKKPASAKRDSAILKAETAVARGLLAGRTCLPTLSPGFVLRADTWLPVFQIDIRRVSRLLLGEVPSPLEDVGSYAVGGLETLRGMKPVVSLDVETDGIHIRTTRMLCVGISDGEKTAVIWPWKKKHAKGLQKWLRSRETVIAHHGAFDIPVLRNHGVT